MPLYSFKCLHCGHQFEELWPYESRNPVCPLCQSTTKRKFGVAALKFKGHGFHVTDYSRYGRRHE